MPALASLAIGVTFVMMLAIILDISPIIPDGGELRHPPSGTSSTLERIDLTIGDMKSSYTVGEHIIVSVRANGTSDWACNIGSPTVVMRDNSDGRIILYPEPLFFSTALLCPQSRIDKTWTYGEEPDELITFDKIGSYAIIASVRDVTVERQFAIVS
jgi:hypothetical protein